MRFSICVLPDLPLVNVGSGNLKAEYLVKYMTFADFYFPIQLKFFLSAIRTNDDVLDKIKTADIAHDNILMIIY